MVLDVSTVIKMGPSPTLGPLPYILATLALGLGLLLLLLSLQRRRRAVALPDGPWGFPILGHLPLLGANPHLKMAEWAKTYGPVFRIRMGSLPAVVLNSHAVIREALLDQGHKLAGRPAFYGFSLLAKGATITFNSYNKSWRSHKALGRAAFALFTKKRINDLQAHVVEEADRAMRAMSASGKPVNPWPLLHEASSSIVFSICFEEGANLREDKNFLRAVQKLEAVNAAFDASANIVDLLPWARPFLRGQMRKIRDIFADFHQCVEETQKRILQSRTPGHPRNLTDALRDALETEKLAVDLTEDQIMAVAVDVMGAGQGTIVIFLSWALLYMIEYPEVQERAAAEIEEALGPEVAPTYADRSRLPFCEAICLETFRMAPSLPFLIPHTALEDCQVRGKTIPKGSLVFVNVITDSQDPEIWQHPERFDPARFIDPETRQIDRAKSENIGAFGMGKRRCMGEFLGRLETFTFLVRFLQRWRFRKAEGESYSLDPIIRFTWEPQRYRLMMEPRHGV